MRPSDIEKACRAAKEFLRRAQVVMRLVEGESTSSWNPKHIAALRRQSMELTRALEDMRHPEKELAAERNTKKRKAK